MTDGVQLRLGALSGVTSIDATRGEATVRAGTPLHVLNEELAAFGYALPNLGDIDRQSIAGATGTGTHGTGLRLTGLSAGIRALRLVLADGSVVECSPTQRARALPGRPSGARRARHRHRDHASPSCRPSCSTPWRRPEPLHRLLDARRRRGARPTTTSSSTGSRTPTGP